MAIDLYLGSIFQQMTFFTHYSEHLSIAASDDLYQFCNFGLSFLKILSSQKQNMQTNFTEVSVDKISHIGVFRCFPSICFPIIKKRWNQLKYFQALQSLHHNYLSLVFSTWTKRQIPKQMLTISGDKWP